MWGDRLYFFCSDEGSQGNGKDVGKGFASHAIKRKIFLEELVK